MKKKTSYVIGVDVAKAKLDVFDNQSKQGKVWGERGEAEGPRSPPRASVVTAVR